MTVCVRIIVATAIMFAYACAGAETLKLAIGQRGNWETAVSQLGQQAGFFKKRGLDLELLYTEGSGETLQAVISGSVDIGVGAGTYGALGAFAKGAPVRAIGAATTGASDLYWYVPAGSPIHSMKDTSGKTIAYSTRGASTNLVVAGFVKYFGVDARPVATGSPAATLTQAMSGQIDVGWASPPFGLDAADQGKIRILAHGNDVPYFRDQTVRILISNARVLAGKRDALTRYMQAYRETLVWMYREPAALKAYAAWVRISEDTAAKVRDGFYPQANLNPDRIVGMDQVMKDAVQLKYLSAPLPAGKMREFVQLLPK